ncbi:hypothetical protein T484DRAFT_1912098 [Baffinella frigidus]|nr:hypothetical protein T484DRAFT_1912098 [Cryptophyta sp. CCMP2293]
MGSPSRHLVAATACALLVALVAMHSKNKPALPKTRTDATAVDRRGASATPPTQTEVQLLAGSADMGDDDKSVGRELLLPTPPAWIADAVHISEWARTQVLISMLIRTRDEADVAERGELQEASALLDGTTLLDAEDLLATPPT